MLTTTIHILTGPFVIEVQSTSIVECLNAGARFAEPGWNIARTTTAHYPGSQAIRSHEVWFAGNGMVHFEHLYGNLYTMTHL